MYILCCPAVMTMTSAFLDSLLHFLSVFSEEPAFPGAVVEARLIPEPQRFICYLLIDILTAGENSPRFIGCSIEKEKKKMKTKLRMRTGATRKLERVFILTPQWCL